MPDREKVLAYLNSEIYRAEQSVNDIWLECVEVKLLRDALSLLKEQEAVEPKRGFAWTQKAWFCGACGFRLNKAGRFCSKCGRAVKWDESKV